MRKRTPGPWEVIPERDDSNLHHSIYSEGYKGVLIARCNQNGSHDADSLLIAAAPDLLDALVSITNQLERVGDSRKDAVFIEEARAAISKAEGRA